MLRELKTFLMVTRAGSFALAGERVGLTQSAVSAQMQRLEEALGTELFERTGRSARLNAFGRAAVAKAEQIVSLFEALGSELETSALRGTLRLGAISTIQTGPLPAALKSFQAHYPQVSVRIVPGSSVQLLSQVDSGEIDAAILVEPPFVLPKELSWRALLRERFTLIVPNEIYSKRSGWKDYLLTHRFVRYDRGSFGGRLVERFLRRHRLAVDEAIELDDLAAMVRMVGQGLGVALVPASGALITPDVRCVELGREVFYRNLGVVERAEGEREWVGAFVKGLVGSARDFSRMAKGSG